jgi:hypothetical protein
MFNVVNEGVVISTMGEYREYHTLTWLSSCRVRLATVFGCHGKHPVFEILAVRDLQLHTFIHVNVLGKHTWLSIPSTSFSTLI